MTEPSKEVRETESDGEFYDACDDLTEEVKEDKKRENEKIFLENFDSDEEEDESDLPDFESRPEVKKLKSKLNKLHLSDDVDFKKNDSDTKQDDDDDEENKEQEKVRVTQI